MRFFYELILHVLALYYLRKWKYWKRAKVRLGFGFPKVEKGKRRLVWVHAVSLGETRAIAPLIKKLKELENPPLILLSTTTDTGFAEGKRSLPDVDYHVFLPWDFGYIIRPIVKRVSPDALILTETDFWYNLEDAVKKEGGSIFLVNGKISKRSYERLLRFPFVARTLLDPIDLFCLQGENYARRFTTLGISEEKIVITGNIKLDGFSKEEDSASWKKTLGIEEGDLVLTLGSTHDPEEEILINSITQLIDRYPKLKVLLVPRHSERFDLVESLLSKKGLSYGRLTKGSLGKVTLIDMMGNLRKCYQVSDLAFVGGSLTDRVGGHNILEPASYGVPVMFGPYMHSQPDFLELVKSYEAGVQVGMDGVKEALDRLLSNEDLRKKMGNNGLRLVSEGKGALNETLNAMFACDKRMTSGKIFSLSRDGAVVSSLGS